MLTLSMTLLRVLSRVPVVLQLSLLKNSTRVAIRRMYNIQFRLLQPPLAADGRFHFPDEDTLPTLYGNRTKSSTQSPFNSLRMIHKITNGLITAHTTTIQTLRDLALAGLRSQSRMTRSLRAPKSNSRAEFSSQGFNLPSV